MPHEAQNEHHGVFRPGGGYRDWFYIPFSSDSTVDSWKSESPTRRQPALRYIKWCVSTSCAKVHRPRNGISARTVRWNRDYGLFLITAPPASRRAQRDDG